MHVEKSNHTVSRMEGWLCLVAHVAEPTHTPA